MTTRLLTLPYGTFRMIDDDWITASSEEHGFWDLDLKPYLDAVPPGGCMVDVGAHVGLYAGYLASRGCSVLALEGHPLYLPLLVENMQAFPAVEIVPTFVYSCACRVSEVLENSTRASNTWLPGERGLLAVALDDLVAPDRIDLLKVDAQGADLHVLLGADRWIAEHRPAILFEFEPDLAERHGHKNVDYDQWAIARGYRHVPINGTNAYLVPEERT